MSVLVRGIEMPITCCQCPLMGYDPDIEWNDGGRGARGAYICVLTHELIDNTKREEHCPLIEIPPHGDLIDRREAIIDAHERAYDFWLSDDEVNATIQFLNEQTAVIPAEEGET